MAIKMSRFARDKLTMIVNFPVKLNGRNSKITSYVLDKKINVNEDVFEFLGEEYSDKKKIKALNLVKLKSSLFNIKVSSLTKLEMKKVCLAKAFLSNSKVIILEYFFEEQIYSEREYFKRLFNNLINILLNTFKLILIWYIKFLLKYLIFGSNEIISLRISFC